MMIPCPSKHSNLAVLLSACALAAAGVGANCPSFADAPASANGALTDVVRGYDVQQTDIKAQLQGTSNDLSNLISEYERNGLGQGDDVKTLRQVRGMLQNLSGKQMDDVINTLQQARGAGDASKIKQGVADAYVGQKNIISQLQRILTEFQHQQELSDLALHFGQLAQQQNDNLKAARHFVRDLPAGTDNLDEDRQAALKVQQAQEDSISDETNTLLAKLDQLRKESEGPTADQLKNVLEQLPPQKLRDVLREASSDLRQNDIFRAAVGEKDARVQLHKMSRLVAPPKNDAELLHQAAEDLDRLIALQKSLIEHTASAKALPASSTVAAGLEDDQADNADSADDIRQDISTAAPAAAQTLADAQDKMQEVRGALSSAPPQLNPAQSGEELALAQLQAARKQLDDQIKKLQLAANPQDKLDAVKELKQELAALKNEEQQIKAQTPAAEKTAVAAQLAEKQQQLQQKTAALMDKIQRNTPQAAEAVQNAANDMSHAADELKQPSPQHSATVPEQNAVDHLAQAEKQLDQQVAQLEEEKKREDAIQAARDKIADLLKHEQAMEIQTAMNSQPQKNSPANNQNQPPNPSNQDLAQQQQQLADQTSQVQKNLPREAAPADEPLQQAQNAMNQAQKALQRNQPAAAEPAQRQASNNLKKAAAALDQQLAQMDADLGKPSDQAEQMQQAQEAIAAAQKDLENAQRQMEQPQGDPQQAMQDIKEADQHDADAQAQANLPEDAQHALEEAHQAMAHAAADEHAGNEHAAHEEAQEAGHELAQAEHAMEVSEEAGKEPGHEPGEEAGHEPGHEPGQEPGEETADSQSQDPSKGDAHGKSNGATKEGQQGSISANAGGAGSAGEAKFIGLPPRERAAILQSQQEKYPEEYSGMIEQYFKNLADDTRK